jgi:protein-tyrosine phosphatase
VRDPAQGGIRESTNGRVPVDDGCDLGTDAARRTPSEIDLCRESAVVHDGRMDFDGPTTKPVEPFRINFVCAGNICRSPMAEVVFAHLIDRAGLRRHVEVASSGTGDWHVGERADERTVAALHRRGYDGRAHRARQFDPDWFDGLDLVVALDRSHERILRSWARVEEDRAKIGLLLSFDRTQSSLADVPDPYYSDERTFDEVLGMIERACTALFRQLEPAVRQGATL